MLILDLLDSDKACILFMQSVLNGDAFNPTNGCSNAKYCTGNGGLLAFMETPSPACTSTAQTTEAMNPASKPSPGAIAGIVLGSIFGALLVCTLIWLYLKRG
jgi:hypothetical protein